MIKKTFLLLIFLSIFLFGGLTSIKAAPIGNGSFCDPVKIANKTDTCSSGYSCLFDSAAGLTQCEPDVIGQVETPQAIKDFGVGSEGISKFLNNVITLIYMIASVVFVFMILISAFQWLTSGGNKESLDSARKRLTYAIVGIILFAIAFAVLRVLDIFTGFTFFIPKGLSSCEDKYYFDDQANVCMHKYTTTPPCEPYAYIRVDSRFCGK